MEQLLIIVGQLLVLLGLFVVAVVWLAGCERIIRTGGIGKTMQRLSKVLAWTVLMGIAGWVIGSKGFVTLQENIKHALVGGALGLAIGLLVPLKLVDKPRT